MAADILNRLFVFKKFLNSDKIFDKNQRLTGNLNVSFNKKFLKFMNPQHLLFILSAIYACLAQHNTYYCASNCADYLKACFGPSFDQCYACEERLFLRKSDNGTCIELPQHQILFEELKTEDMDLTGYSTNNPIPTTCGGYGLSGKYTSGAYIAKTFTIPTSNYY